MKNWAYLAAMTFFAPANAETGKSTAEIHNMIQQTSCHAAQALLSLSPNQISGKEISPSALRTRGALEGMIYTQAWERYAHLASRPDGIATGYLSLWIKIVIHCQENPAKPFIQAFDELWKEKQSPK